MLYHHIASLLLMTPGGGNDCLSCVDLVGWTIQADNGEFFGSTPVHEGTPIRAMMWGGSNSESFCEDFEKRCGTLCDMVSGFGTVLYPDGSEFTIDHNGYGFGCPTSLPAIMLSFPPYITDQDDVGGCLAKVFFYHESVNPNGQTNTQSTGQYIKIIDVDLDNNGIVDALDMKCLLLGWTDGQGLLPDCEDTDPDTNCDGLVDIQDFLNLIWYYGQKVPQND